MGPFVQVALWLIVVFILGCLGFLALRVSYLVLAPVLLVAALIYIVKNVKS
jgi:hypothetical protein